MANSQKGHFSMDGKCAIQPTVCRPIEGYSWGRMRNRRFGGYSKPIAAAPLSIASAGGLLPYDVGRFLSGSLIIPGGVLAICFAMKHNGSGKIASASLPVGWPTGDCYLSRWSV